MISQKDKTSTRSPESVRPYLSEEISYTTAVLTIYTERSFSFHRADMQKVLVANLKSPQVLHLGKRFVSSKQLNENAAIEVAFQDGTTATCDILVGCDGIRSTVRATMYSQLADTASAEGNEAQAEVLRSRIPPKWSGAVVYRCLIRKDTLTDEAARHPAIAKHSLVVVSGRDCFGFKS